MKLTKIVIEGGGVQQRPKELVVVDSHFSSSVPWALPSWDPTVVGGEMGRAVSRVRVGARRAMWERRENFLVMHAPTNAKIGKLNHDISPSA
jgi:hypothetical protein